MSTDLELVDDELAGQLAAAALSATRALGEQSVIWCVAPEQPEHAQHLAVEFVHPVIVGKPALRAVSLDSPDLVATLRTQVSPGDIVIGVGSASPELRNLFARTSTWGVRSIWIGAGHRPTAPTADHVLWFDREPETALRDGRAVLTYHLLWELVHVCLEHGVEPEATADVDSDHCITCSDEGRVAEIVSVSDDGLASVRVDGVTETVDTSLLAGVGPDDLILVHAGAAIASVDPEAAT